MRIVIDLQGAQLARQGEAIASEAMDFARLICEHSGRHEVFLVLNGDIAESVLAMRTRLADVCAPERLLVWHGHASPCLSTEQQTRTNALLREAFLADLRPDIVHFTGDVFCSRTQEAVFSHAGLIAGIPLTACLYPAAGNRPTPSANQGTHPVRISAFLDLCDRSAAAEERIWYNGDLVEAFATPIYRASNLDNSPDQETLPGGALMILAIWQRLVTAACAKKKGLRKKAPRPRLAHVSPLPPEQSGIADYSAQLIPHLANHFQIDVITDQETVACPWIKNNCAILSSSEFLQNADQYAHVLYHFGNNPMHRQMPEMLDKAPGVVVLHDFFLSGLHWYRENQGLVKNALWQALYRSHGYGALQYRDINQDEAAVFRFPCNYGVIQAASAVILHSGYARDLLNEWCQTDKPARVIPLLRQPVELSDRIKARRELGIADHEFVVCSFGFIGKTKLNHRLLDAWQHSRLLCKDRSSRLIFVGASDDSAYAQELSARMGRKGAVRNVRLTGWVGPDDYARYLLAADAAVQLRSFSRGETSAALLDCMNFGLPTIINANGSMAEMPDEVVRKIPDHFSDHELIEQLEWMLGQAEERRRLGNRARRLVQTEHAPERASQAYAGFIAGLGTAKRDSLKGLIAELAEVLPSDLPDEELIELSSTIANNQPERKPFKSLFVDVSVVVRDDFKTGIQRAVRALLLEMIKNPPHGYRVEPVFLDQGAKGWMYQHARTYTLQLLGIPGDCLSNEPVDAQAGDILLGLDLAGGYVVNADREGVFESLRCRGVSVGFVVYDLIPVQYDGFYPDGFQEGHATWLRVVARCDWVVCISNAVAGDLSCWIRNHVENHNPDLRIDSFRLGADITESSPSRGLPEGHDTLCRRFSATTTFLMVGTIEPRKGHRQVLDAFDRLWAAGWSLNLVIVGKQGWMVDDLVDRLRSHPHRQQQLFWLEGTSDEFLEKIYAASSCLIAASHAEGFGLPLIESAQHGLPIIARDIPVFREVAGDHAHYFRDDGPEPLARTITQWLELYQQGRHPQSQQITWLTWKESAAQLLARIGLSNPGTNRCQQ